MSVRWLHFSDLHVGMREQGWLWPRYGNQLLEDLARLSDKAGPWDFIVFSGDLVNKGTVEEFNRLDEVLDSIWTRLEGLGCNPPLVTVPGNHDLQRSDSMAPELLALEQYWNDERIRADIWKDGSLFKRYISDRFENYKAWMTRSIASGRHAAPVLTGYFPGDASYSLDCDGGRVGFACLNSTWLQLGAGDYSESLNVDARQLMMITDDDPDAWVKQFDTALLITHQPASWLKAASLESWNSEINPSGRFDLHLFGHMHEPAITRVAVGGSMGRRGAQAASLFGLEKLPNGEIQRIQGYSSFKLSSNNEIKAVQCWPRVVVKTGDGDRKLAADVTQDLEEDNSFTISYSVDHRSALSTSTIAYTKSSNKKVLETDEYDVSTIRLPLRNTRAHSFVRKVEQVEFAKSLNEYGAAWLVSDWGMSAASFIGTVLNEISVSEDDVFRLDCSEYTTLESFRSKLLSSLGASFENVILALGNKGSSIILLDEVPVFNSSTDNSPSVTKEMERLVGIIKDFAPEAKIILKSRIAPELGNLPSVKLTAFDEADLTMYLRESELGSPRYARPDAAGIIFRRTDGVPLRVDDALRDLQVTSLSDLAASNPDLADSGDQAGDAPRSLVIAFDDLRSSTDADAPRAFELLLALSALPYGEQLTRIKRFLGVHPFSAKHATYLLDRGLLMSVTLSGMGEGDSIEQVRALVVPRIVREYILSVMDEEAIRRTDRAVLAMYFGERWAQGEISNSPTGKRAKNALSEGYEINNATTVILRMLLRSIKSDDSVTLEALLRLSGSFVAALLTGSHFRSVSLFTADILPLVEDSSYQREASVFKMQRARALRMLSEYKASIDCFDSIDLSLLTKDQRQNALIQGALACESFNKPDTAATLAKRAISVAPKAAYALHGELVIAEQIEDQKERIAKLNQLLTVAKKRGSKIMANNILISLASEPNTAMQEDRLREVVESARVTKDFWNVCRATITLAERIESGLDVSQDMRDRLVDAYHFLHAERISGMFDRCHERLWKIFEDNGDNENLLNLYRHSSFIWRLNGKDHLEQQYVRRLSSKITQLVGSNLHNVDRDRAYFMVRVSAILGAPPAPSSQRSPSA
ncbi:metallophosphoesterase family protein [Sphingomonas endophytica]|uniref:metallophosphoesterase family protein n=1 Tax=Sphingomonas endophytica TaxID=869719 RepID=UPI000A4ADDAD|nr:metallophosphoesterase [Sphingomonas endophytica]